MNRQAQRYAAASRLLAGIYACSESCWEITKQALNDADCLLSLVEATGPVVDDHIPCSEKMVDEPGYRFHPRQLELMSPEDTKRVRDAERDRFIEAVVRNSNFQVADHNGANRRYVTRADLEKLLETKP